MGQAYISATTKKYIPARTLKKTCGPGCRFACEQKVSEEARGNFLKIFENIRIDLSELIFYSTRIYES